MNVWFTSDTHFNHTNIIEYCDRPFDSVEEMNETIIRRWNDRVDHDDHVYHLGDVGLGRAGDLNPILNRLNGKIYLIRGNHESCAQNKMNRDRFEWIRYYYILNCGMYNPDWNDYELILFHFPIETWNKRHYGTVHLHGHIHSGDQKTSENRFDVGVDSWGFEPVRLEEFIPI